MMKRNKDKAKNNGTSQKSSGKVLDFIAKIACLVIAFFIWFYAMSTDVITLEKDFTVPVRFENENALFERTGWAVLSGKESNIVVTVKGKRNIVNKITDKDIYAFVDVSEVNKAGRQMLDVKVTAPTECEIINTSVTSISPYIDKRITKNVPVKVVYSEYVIDLEHQLDEPLLNLEEIAITGPESELERVSVAMAELSLGNVTGTVNTTGSLKLVDKDGYAVSSNYITMTTKTVNVTVRLYTIKSVPLTVGYKYGYFNDNNVKITVTPAIITLRGEPSTLENINELKIATLDEKKFVRNSTQNVTIDIPSGVTVMGGETSASVSVEHINTDVKQIAVDTINLSNSGGLNCELQTKTLNIMLRGPYALLSKIDKGDITVTADMKNYASGSGITVVPVAVKISSEFENEVYELESYSVTVDIK